MLRDGKNTQRTKEGSIYNELLVSHGERWTTVDFSKPFQRFLYSSTRDHLRHIVRQGEHGEVSHALERAELIATIALNLAVFHEYREALMVFVHREPLFLYIRRKVSQ